MYASEESCRANARKWPQFLGQNSCCTPRHRVRPSHRDGCRECLAAPAVEPWCSAGFACRVGVSGNLCGLGMRPGPAGEDPACTRPVVSPRFAFPSTVVLEPARGCFLRCVTVHASIVLLFRLVPFPIADFRGGYDFSFIPSISLQWIAVVLSAISAGVCEETGFRGYMQRPIEQRHGPAVAILISSLFFTAVHLTKSWAMAGMLPIVFGAGVLLGFLPTLPDRSSLACSGTSSWISVCLLIGGRASLELSLRCRLASPVSREVDGYGGVIRRAVFRADPGRVAGCRESAPPCPAFADGGCRSSRVECPGA